MDAERQALVRWKHRKLGHVGCEMAKDGSGEWVLYKDALEAAQVRPLSEIRAEPPAAPPAAEPPQSMSSQHAQNMRVVQLEAEVAALRAAQEKDAQAFQVALTDAGRAFLYELKAARLERDTALAEVAALRIRTDEATMARATAEGEAMLADRQRDAALARAQKAEQERDEALNFNEQAHKTLNAAGIPCEAPVLYLAERCAYLVAQRDEAQLGLDDRLVALTNRAMKAEAALGDNREDDAGRG